MNNQEEQTEITAAGIQRLIATLPHRYPFLLVDRIIDINGSESAVGIKNVTINEPHFAGHFPENPIMPGVLIIEAMAQTAGAICLLQLDNMQKPIVRFMSIDKASFRKPVFPGDQLMIHVKKLRRVKNAYRYACEARVGKAIVAEAELMAMVGHDEPRVA